MFVYSPFCTHAGVWGQEPRGVHDSAEAAAEDEAGLDAHRAPALGALRGRYVLGPTAAGMGELGANEDFPFALVVPTSRGFVLSGIYRLYRTSSK